jgi:hypothetical protein
MASPLAGEEEEGEMTEAKKETPVVSPNGAEEEKEKEKAKDSEEPSNPVVEGEPSEEGETQEQLEPTKSLDFATLRRQQQEAELSEAAKNVIEPLKMLRKGAVAAVGGTIVGIGLIMIPLPTPCGAVVASAGLAVLGTEFNAAREMNEKIIDTTKTHFESARDRIVLGIQSMDGDEDDDEEGSPQEEDDAIDKESSPFWLHMNPAERKRQEKVVKENYKKENETRYQATKEYIRRGAGSLLSRTILPLLKPSTKEVPLPTASTDEETPEPEAEATEEEDSQQDDENPAESSPTQSPVNDASNNATVVVDVADAPTLEPAELSPTQSVPEEASNATVVDVADAPVLEESPMASKLPVVAAV